MYNGTIQNVTLRKKKKEKKLRQLARKDHAFWAQMRSCRKLITKMPISEDERYNLLDQIDSELADILDKRVINYPRTLSQLQIDKETSFAKKKELLQIPDYKKKYSEKEQTFLDLMQQKAENGRKANWQWRIAEESEQLQKAGWYPFFITLTVDPKKTDPETLWKEGREFQKWIRKLTKIVTDTMGHPPCNKPPYNKQSDYLKYAGVIEHGKSKEHHHGHFLVWMREIPSSWKQCPNRSIINPAAKTKNECKELSVQWEWSSYNPATGEYLSPALYYRTVGDIYTTLGFTLPLKEGKPMRVSTAGAAGKYITKYLQKEYKQWHHRMKATRNIGMARLKRAMAKMTPTQIQALEFRPSNSKQLHSLSLIHSVPLGLIRSEAKQINYWNLYRLGLTELRTLLRPNYATFTKMLASIRGGARPERMHSLQFYDWVSLHLPDQIGYCEKEQIETHSLLCKEFPRNYIRVEPVKLGANEIGFTQCI